jgi:hypothetical protein
MRIWKYLAIAIRASHNYGWIAIGLYARHLQRKCENNYFYETFHDYYKSMGEYKFDPNVMCLAEDYRFFVFPEEIGQMFKAIATYDFSKWSDLTRWKYKVTYNLKWFDVKAVKERESKVLMDALRAARNSDY